MSSAANRTPMRAALACVWLIAAAAQGQQPLPPDAGLQSFDENVARYAALRARLEEPLPAFDDPRRDGWSVMLMRRYLASAIRTARRGVEPGEVFAPAAGAFRDMIARAIYDIDIEGLVDAGPGEDGFVLDLALYEPIPEWALLPVPAPLLEQLPPLPEAIEYRIAAGALLLWDTHAEILIDALPDAFVAPER